MTIIRLETKINAPVARCFDLSRSIDLHQQSMKHTNEKAIAGRTSGLIEVNEFVTWKAKHFFVYQQLTVKITEMKAPLYFKDVMKAGPFTSMEHLHEFTVINENETLMMDEFHYQVPYGFVGELFDRIVLKNYMRSLLTKRNNAIKATAERDL